MYLHFRNIRISHPQDTVENGSYNRHLWLAIQISQEGKRERVADSTPILNRRNTQRTEFLPQKLIKALIMQRFKEVQEIVLMALHTQPTLRQDRTVKTDNLLWLNREMTTTLERGRGIGYEPLTAKSYDSDSRSGAATDVDETSDGSDTSLSTQSIPRPILLCPDIAPRRRLPRVRSQCAYRPSRYGSRAHADIPHVS